MARPAPGVRLLGVTLAVALAVGILSVAGGAAATSGAGVAWGDSAAPLEVTGTATTGNGNCQTGAVTITFSANASGGVPPYTAAWAFPDGAQAAGFVVTHHFSSWAAPANATVTVTDAEGFTATASVPVLVVYPPCAVEIGGGWSGGFPLLGIVLGGLGVAVAAVLAVSAVVWYRGRRGRLNPPDRPAP